MDTVTGRRRPGSEVGGRDARGGEVLWPVSFRDAPQARSTAYGLAGLVLEFSVAVAFGRYYWADSNWPRSPLGWFLAAWTAPSVLLMCGALAGTLTARRNSVFRRSLSALAWTASVLTSLSLPLLLAASSADLCETNPPPTPAYLEPALMVPVCLAASLALGSLAGFGAWTVTRRRIPHIALYAVWLVSAAVAVFLLLAPILTASPTCSPITNG
ncbi:hypothetical protein OG562_26910 [Streptomyces sp. NBC_01275]|uniref:hypothetical protein n=1 Tax=Streptomyces sp. NBC_01275 TaxID=2903807 RepID=UPI00225129F2|nr:hypothetical protein [Streptomyces sp. NBC_01275]MCX4764528.1 hypothetical protein [Streptomyces sp. NBC_01275]